jgi:hypothetical protein
MIGCWDVSNPHAIVEAATLTFPRMNYIPNRCNRPKPDQNDTCVIHGDRSYGQRRWHAEQHHLESNPQQRYHVLSKLIAIGMAYARAKACTPTETKAVKALVLPRLINPRSICTMVTKPKALTGTPRRGFTVAL